MRSWSQPIEAVTAGVICLLVLTAMMLLHAWPLWTGEVVTVPVTLSQSHDPFRGERVSIAPPGGRVVVGTPATTAPASGALVIQPSGDWWSRVPADPKGRRRAVIARVVYLQLERGVDATYRPVSIGLGPIKDMVNLKGRIRGVDASGTLDVDYGIDSFYMEEGQARQVERALKAGGRVQMQLAIARSGRARIKSLSIDGRTIS
jgi:hypothetical protein